MTDEFILNVKYKGVTLGLKTHLELKGYSYQLVVQLDETEVYFEPDEEKFYRAVAMPGQNERLLRRIDPELLEEIAITLKGVLA